ncbi:NfeD family protein [Sporomusa aerivorans]|uniref:NfeD family protein n=1 Tax=Sporomusa aerivorans TaxID=204936 RepID=UPI00352B3EF1
MLEIYWGCFLFGVIFAAGTLLFGDVLHNAVSLSTEFSLEHLAWLQPMVIVGGITGFGGSGLLLARYTELTDPAVVIFSVCIAALLSVLVYFVYVKPMRHCENSSGFFITDLIGKTGEVIVLIPAGGFGEVLIRVGAGNTNQTAASYSKIELPAGTKIVVAEIREGVLYVYRNNKQSGGRAE